MPNNLMGAVILGIGFTIGVAVAQFALRLVGQGAQG